MPAAFAAANQSRRGPLGLEQARVLARAVWQFLQFFQRRSTEIARKTILPPMVTAGYNLSQCAELACERCREVPPRPNGASQWCPTETG